MTNNTEIIVNSFPDNNPDNNPDLVVGEDGLARPVWAAKNEMLRNYYDTEWGMPVYGEQAHFERLCLEGFQSGLSWALVLRKREALRRAFCHFDPDTVAGFTEEDVEHLLQDESIIRNRRKIEAVITNARATVALREEGGLEEFLWNYQPQETPVPYSQAQVPASSPESHALAQALKQKGFTFVGPKTMYSLMEAVGIVDTHLVGSHRRGTSGVWPKDEDEF